jgi:AmmeMemoRadiSam system protein A
MAPSPSAEPSLRDQEAARLLDLADDAILDGLLGRPFVAPDLAALPLALRRPTGAFVTLNVDGELNGCIGTVEAVEALASAVPRLARSAAFSDPRLPALRLADYPSLTIEVSVLSPLAPASAGSRRELLDRLRPGMDGLVVAAGPRQAVFLPAVWEKLADPEAFLDHLQHKAGLRGTWPQGMRAWTFAVQRLARPVGERSGSVTAA